MTRILTASVAVSALLSAPALAQSVFELDEIIFSATAQPLILQRIGVSVEVLELEALEQPSASQLADALTRLPGISVIENGPPGTQSQLRIRGGGAEFVSVYLDGILVQDPTHPSGAFDNIGGLTSGAVRRVEILRGPQSALYGGTPVSGVVNITTLADADTPLGLSQTAEIQGGSNATLSADYALTHVTETSRLSFGLSTITSDGFSSADEANGNTEADPYNQTRLTFGYSHDVTGALTLGVNGFYETGENAFDDFGFIPALGVFGPTDGTLDDTVAREAAGLRFSALYSMGDWTHEADIDGYWITRTNDQNGTVTEFDGERYTFSYVGGYRASDLLLVSFGLDARSETATYANQAGGSNSIDAFGAFLEAVWSPSADLDITGTLRHDEHSSFGGQPTGRVALAYRPMEGLTLRGAVGTGYRPPSLDELFGDYAAFEFVGNPNLTPETSTSFEVGADYEYASGAQVSATVFFQRIDDLITYVDCPRSPPFFGCDLGTIGTLENVSGVSERSGLELAAAVPLSDRLTLTGAYTYTDAYNADGSRLVNIPRHDIVLGLDAALSDRISLGMTAQFVGDRISGGFDPNPYEDYTLVDTTLGFAVTSEMEAFFRIENLFDEQYQTSSGYGTPGRTVYVGLRASF